MSAVLTLAKTVTQDDVELAWATYRALLITEVDSPILLADEVHQRALEIAKRRFQNLYREWAAQ
jgi:hypothetical protein